MTDTAAPRTGDVRSGSDLQRLWAARSILKLLIVRDLKVKYADSYLGYLWSVLEPLLMTLVYYVVFAVILGRTSPEKPYMIFLLSGQLAWYWFNGSVIQLMSAFKADAALVRSTSLPRLLWVVRIVASNFVQYLFSLVVLVLFVLLYRKGINPVGLLLYPVGLVMQFAMLMGLGMILAPLSVMVRDLDKVIRILLRVTFYLAPILYSTHDPHVRKVEVLFAFNPMSGLLAIYREVFFHDELRASYLLGSLGFTVFVVIVGAFVFKRLEATVLKEI